MASIDKVLAQIGVENVSVQYLGECMTNIKTGKKETEISFVTQELTANDAMRGSSKTAMIVWVDSAQYNQATAELKKLESKPDPLVEALQSVVDLQKAKYGDGMGTHMALHTLVDETLVPLLAKVGA